MMSMKTLVHLMMMIVMMSNLPLLLKMKLQLVIYGQKHRREVHELFVSNSIFSLNSLTPGALWQKCIFWTVWALIACIQYMYEQN